MCLLFKFCKQAASAFVDLVFLLSLFRIFSVLSQVSISRKVDENTSCDRHAMQGSEGEEVKAFLSLVQIKASTRGQRFEVD